MPKPSRAAPETVGALLRVLRDRPVPKINQKAAADLLRAAFPASGMRPDYWSAVERRESEPGETSDSAVDTVAMMFSVLPMTAADDAVLHALSPKVARRLVEIRQSAPVPAPAKAAPEETSDLEDQFVIDGIRARDENGQPVIPEHHQKVLIMLWMQTDRNGRRLERATRDKQMREWKQMYIDRDDEDDNGESTAASI